MFNQIIYVILALIAYPLGYSAQFVKWHRDFILLRWLKAGYQNKFYFFSLVFGHCFVSFVVGWLLGPVAGASLVIGGFIIGVIGKFRLIPGNIFTSFRNARKMQYVSFLGISCAVFYYLHRRKPKKFEALADDIETYGYSPKNTIGLMTYGLRIGSIAAAFLDAGRAISPAHTYKTSLIIEIIRAFSDIFVNNNNKNDRTYASQSYENMEDVPVIERAGLGWMRDMFGLGPMEEDDEDEQELTFWMKVVEFKTRVATVIYSRRYEIGGVALASLCGVLLYLALRRPAVLTKSFEDKGKTKKGRGATKNTGSELRGRTTQQYVLYDDNTITDLLKDGDFVSWKEFAGKALPDGEYSVTRFIDGRYVTEDFKVDSTKPSRPGSHWVDKGEPSTKHTMKDHKGRRHRKENLDDLKCGFEKDGKKCLYTAKKETKYLKHIATHCDEAHTVKSLDLHFTWGCDCGLKFSDYKEFEGHLFSHGKYEALVPTSPAYKTDVICEFKGKLLNSEGEHLQDCLFTNIGIIANAHSAAQVKKVTFRGITYDLGPRVEYPGLHYDTVVFKRPEGTAGLAKKFFDRAEQGQKVIVLSSLGLSQGSVSKIWQHNGSTCLSVTATTAKGWCGSPYVNTNGKVVAIHFSEGDKDKNNWGMAVDDAFLKAFDNPKN
jgi:hypothetical protein